MLNLTVIDRAGAEHLIAGDDDQTVMEVIRDSGIDDIIGVCGGCCSCGTCHVIVDPAFTHALPPMSEDELDLLNASQYLAPTSRLACQLPLHASLAGLRITLPPEA